MGLWRILFGGKQAAPSECEGGECDECEQGDPHAPIGYVVRATDAKGAVVYEREFLRADYFNPLSCDKDASQHFEHVRTLLTGDVTTMLPVRREEVLVAGCGPADDVTNGEGRIELDPPLSRNVEG